MPQVETSTRKIASMLLRDGWIGVGGGKHDKYTHPDKPRIIIVLPRHREQSLGVARSIARLAGWL